MRQIIRIIATTISTIITSVIVCLLALITAGNLDCQTTIPYGLFCALRMQDKAGISVQYVDSLTIWQWGKGGCCNERVYPKGDN